MDPRDEPGQLLFAGFEGTGLPPDLGARIELGRVGGVVLFARNVRDPEQLRALVGELHARAPTEAPLVVGIDQEGGRVQRLRAPWTEWPPMRALGARRDTGATRDLARALGRELADLGIDLDFAPVADVDTNPGNPIIGDRAFSDDADTVARHVAAFVGALQSEGVAACAKHFPGHGDTAEDSHRTLPRVPHGRERLRALELRPFRAAAEAGVACVMTAHVVVSPVDPGRPATLSPEVLALLRGELGFDGLVLTDDLEMAAIADRYAPRTLVPAALGAGADVLLVCRRADLREDVLGALEAAPPGLLRASLRRLAAFKRRFAGGRRRSRRGPPYAPHRALAARLGGGGDPTNRSV